MIAYLGASLGYLMTGVVIVEAIYDIPGVGNLILDSVARRDRAVVVGGVLVRCVGGDEPDQIDIVDWQEAVADVRRLVGQTSTRSAPVRSLPTSGAE